MPIGPRGEKRPISSVSSMVKAMKVATGIEPEEYVGGKPLIEEQVAALRVKKPKKEAKNKAKS